MNKYIGGVNLWEIELTEWAGSVVGESCVWGESDCILLGLQAIDIIRGTFDADEWLNKWTDDATARAYLADVQTPVAYLESIEAFRIRKQYAAIGDILISETDDFPVCAHVCLGSRCLSGMPGETINLLPLPWILKTDPVVWRVG